MYNVNELLIIKTSSGKHIGLLIINPDKLFFFFTIEASFSSRGQIYLAHLKDVSLKGDILPAICYNQFEGELSVSQKYVVTLVMTSLIWINLS